MCAYKDNTQGGRTVILNQNIKSSNLLVSTVASNIKLLMWKHESGHKARKFKCTFQFPKRLGEHLPVHTEINKCPCMHCHLSYNSLRAMRQHVKTHQNVEYQCEVCKKQFRDPGYLRHHCYVVSLSYLLIH